MYKPKHAKTEKSLIYQGRFIKLILDSLNIEDDKYYYIDISLIDLLDDYLESNSFNSYIQAKDYMKYERSLYED